MDFEISCQELKELLDKGEDIFILDVREKYEYDLVNIGGYHIPLGEIESRVQELNKDKHIVVHCHHGGRSAQAASFLKQKGFTKVQNLAGGIDVWACDINSDLPRY